jgi:hypothetical protein
MRGFFLSLTVLVFAGCIFDKSDDGTPITIGPCIGGLTKSFNSMYDTLPPYDSTFIIDTSNNSYVVRFYFHLGCDDEYKALCSISHDSLFLVLEGASNGTSACDCRKLVSVPFAHGSVDSVRFLAVTYSIANTPYPGGTLIKYQ